MSALESAGGPPDTSASDLSQINETLEKLVGDGDPDAFQWAVRAAAAGDTKAAFRVGLKFHNGDGVPKDQVTALKYFRLGANLGDADAMCKIGEYYFDGLGGLKEDKADAFAWIKRSAEGGSAHGAFCVGFFYLYSVGTPRLEKLAVRWIRISVERGSADGYFAMGTLCEQGAWTVEQNYTDAVNWYKKSLQAGSDAAAYDLARLYHDGKGVEQDRLEALKWFRVAAGNSNCDAMYFIGLYHQEGWGGVERDPREALSWFRRATEAGCERGAYSLAQLLDAGTGGVEDKAGVFKYYRLAADAGDTRAMNMVGVYYREGWGGVERDAKEAVSWFRRSIVDSEIRGVDYDMLGAYNLAEALHFGTGVEVNKTEAFGWYRVAADQGEQRAMNMVGRYYQHGLGGVEQDPQEAVDWFRRAAEAGSEWGAFNLAQALFGGMGVVENKAEAFKWYRAAAEKEDSDALACVGRYYREGCGGVDKDPEEAVSWFRRSAEAGGDFGAYELAQALFAGTGVAESKTEAFRWYSVAGDWGEPRAMNMLGRYYQEGWGGVEKDPKKAVSWFRCAAEAGGLGGAFNLAQALHFAAGVVEDRIEAFKWYRFAAGKGEQRALHMVGRYYQEGWGGVEKNPEEAASWFGRASSKYEFLPPCAS